MPEKFNILDRYLLNMKIELLNTKGDYQKKDKLVDGACERLDLLLDMSRNMQIHMNRNYKAMRMLNVETGFGDWIEFTDDDGVKCKVMWKPDMSDYRLGWRERKDD